MQMGAVLSKGTPFAVGPNMGKADAWVHTQVASATSLPVQVLLKSFGDSLDTFAGSDLVRYMRGGASGIEIVSGAGSANLAALRVTARPLDESLDLPGEPSPLQAVRAIDRLVVELGITQEKLFKAANISKRTYHSWTGDNPPRPRRKSIGRLWELADTVMDLRTILDRPVEQWLHAAPGRLEALVAGRFDDLVQAALTSSGTRPTRIYDNYAVSLESAVPIVDEPALNPRTADRGMRL